MRFKSINCNQVGYPVGLYMDSSISFIYEVKKAFEKTNFKEKNINIICTGSSGAIISALLYPVLKEKIDSNRWIQIMHIKKPKEKCHEKTHKILVNKNHINIIIDDFICSGDTMDRIIECLKKENKVVKIDYLIVSSLSLNSNVYKIVKETVNPKYLISNKQDIEWYKNKQNEEK